MNTFDVLRILFFCCLAATCTIGWRRGGSTEKWGVAMIAIASFLTVLVQESSFFDWRSDRLGLVAIDVILLVAFLWLALSSRRFWPLWATAFHLIAVASHVIVFLKPHRILQAYALLQGFWAYPIMLCIILGTRPRRAVRSAGPTPRPS